MEDMTEFKWLVVIVILMLAWIYIFSQHEKW